MVTEQDLMEHLFGRCTFFKVVWLEMGKSLWFDGFWDCPSLEENLKIWITSEKRIYLFPFITMWEVWKVRNRVIF